MSDDGHVFLLKLFKNQEQCLKGQCREKSVQNETVGARLGTKDVSDPNFTVLRCPFNMLRIFKDGAHRYKKYFILVIRIKTEEKAKVVVAV